MKDIYDFLICTLSASLPAVYILIIKRVFRDKLTPLWQFALWAVLAVSLIFPLNVSTNLSFLTETLKTFLSGTVSLSKPVLSVPFIPMKVPNTAEEYLYFIYFSGFVIMLLKYICTLLKLKLMLRKCPEATDKNRETVENTAIKYNLPTFAVRTLNGIFSPFICGIFKPVLVLPKEETDEKIILHELLHLKYKDVLWGIPVALFRCIHWCNPLLWYCFNKINNDIEELCDARVIKLLDGEERREYGNIILSMANSRYASLPGTSSIANGGKNIRSRIETIARFKHYPQGNALVSVCIIILLASGLYIKSNAATIPYDLTDVKDNRSLLVVLSAARSYYCTTPAGAIDTYAYAVMNQDVIYRAASAPLELHEDIRNAVNTSLSNNEELYYPEFTLGYPPYNNDSYYIYNFSKTAKDQYSAYLVFNVFCDDLSTENCNQVAYQKLKIFKEDARWVVLPETDFEYVVTYKMLGDWGCQDLPCFLYTASTEIFTVNAKYQTSFKVSSLSANQDTPLRSAYFSEVYVNSFSECVYTGEEDYKDYITQIGLSVAEHDGEKDFELTSKPSHGNYSSSSSDGSASASVTLRDDWDNIIYLTGGGYSTSYKKNKSYIPEYVAASLYINSELYKELRLDRKD